MDGRPRSNKRAVGGAAAAAGAMVFGDFLPKQKVARSPLRRAKPSRKRCALGIDKNGFRVLACGQPRNDDVCWIPAFAGMTNARASAYPHPALARHPLPRGEGKLDLGLRRDDEQTLERGQVRVRRDEPLRPRVREIHLDAGVRAGAFGADHDAFAEAGVADVLTEFDRQGVV